MGGGEEGNNDGKAGLMAFDMATFEVKQMAGLEVRELIFEIMFATFFRLLLQGFQ
jgi:hypothetical protein